jgi:hypothetical protein
MSVRLGIALYIDPGLGSMVFQILAAGVISTLATFSKVRNGLARLIKRIFRR